VLAVLSGLWHPSCVPTHSAAQPVPPATQALGAYLRAARQSLGLSLRAVEEKTSRAVTNGYLSQMEGGAVAKPSPNVLWALSQAYGIDYGDLLVRAGHRIPHSAETDQRGILAGFPLDAVAELSEAERADLLQYIAFLRSRRPSEGR
jgi:transcriptional regulator with XRE-family HTH domain